MQKDCLIDRADEPKARFIFAHGAGAGMESDFMGAVAKQLSQAGVEVWRFEFPYMQKRREDGKKRPPDRGPKLELYWNELLATVPTDLPLFIGGKSMGGRIASLVADEHNLNGLVCLGFPFHPPGKPDKLKSAHLAEIKTETLIAQGERDTFGKKEEIEQYQLSSKVKVSYLPDGDHSFKPRKSSGFTEEGNVSQAVELIVLFIEGNS